MVSEEEVECGAEFVWSAHLGSFGPSLSWLGLTWVGLGGSSGGLGDAQTNAAVDPRPMWLWLERESWFCGESCCGPSQKLVGIPKYAPNTRVPSGTSICSICSIWECLQYLQCLDPETPPL